MLLKVRCHLVGFARLKPGIGSFDVLQKFYIALFFEFWDDASRQNDKMINLYFGEITIKC